MKPLYRGYLEGYLNHLQQRRTEAQAQRASAPRQPTLTERVDAWWRDLSPEEKVKPFTMEFFKQRFDETPARIGPVLFSLGWKRKRQWQTDKPHRRVWVGPRNN